MVAERIRLKTTVEDGKYDHFGTKINWNSSPNNNNNRILHSKLL